MTTILRFVLLYLKEKIYKFQYDQTSSLMLQLTINPYLSILLLLLHILYSSGPVLLFFIDIFNILPTYLVFLTSSLFYGGLDWR